MADTLYFSRDTQVFVKKGTDVWSMPVLDGFSFSQATNASEITLNEMADTAGNSRRGRQMFTDSYSPAEWSFSTYMRPFTSTGSGAGAASGVSGHHHAVEEILWAMMVGNAAYSTANADGAVVAIDGSVVPTALATADKFGADRTIEGLETSTDGNGNGATLNITYTESSGAFSIAIGTEKGSGYTDNDKLFVSKEAVYDAIMLLDADAPTLLTDLDADFEVSINGVGTGDSGSSFSGFSRDGTDLDINFSQSNKTELGKADIFFVMGGAGSGTKTTYKIADCVVNEASIDFDIDGIATINWSGFGKVITEDSAPTATITEGAGSSDTSNFIRNRLTSLTMSSTSPTTTNYDAVLTGGNITISNNITFLTPETLGVVNLPLGHVTGSRSVSGSFTCYLNAESNSSADLFKNIIEGTTTITNNFDLLFKVGGSSSPRVELHMTDCHLEVPSHSIDDVISLETNFHALPSTIDATDELSVKYVGE